jgi:hypothetical protein
LNCGYDVQAAAMAELAAATPGPDAPGGVAPDMVAPEGRSAGPVMDAEEAAIDGPSAMPRPLSYAKPVMASSRPVPHYRAIGAIALLLEATGLLSMISGGLIFVLDVYRVLAGGQQLNPSIFGSSGAALIQATAAAGVVIVWGVFMMGAGQLLRCIRDIALNTYHLRGT